MPESDDEKSRDEWTDFLRSAHNIAYRLPAYCFGDGRHSRFFQLLILRDFAKINCPLKADPSGLLTRLHELERKVVTSSPNVSGGHFFVISTEWGRLKSFVSRATMIGTIVGLVEEVVLMEFEWTKSFPSPSEFQAPLEILANEGFHEEIPDPFGELLDTFQIRLHISCKEQVACAEGRVSSELILADESLGLCRSSWFFDVDRNGDPRPFNRDGLQYVDSDRQRLLMNGDEIAGWKRDAPAIRKILNYCESVGWKTDEHGRLKLSEDFDDVQGCRQRISELNKRIKETTGSQRIKFSVEDCPISLRWERKRDNG